MKTKVTFILSLLLLFSEVKLIAQSVEFRGMAAGWTTLGYSDQWAGQIGGRYIPQVNLLAPLKNKLTIEGEFSANLAGSFTSPTNGDKLYGKIKPYRMWLKLSGNQFEIRAGLQKINFGSATMLRPLMWFDSIDPRDPLQLTDGVYGLLGRYYTLNNINIWGWGLIGNKHPKGWEVWATDKNKIEYGGRIQFPIPRAELAFSYHYRKALVDEGIALPDIKVIPENRFGIDLRADLGIGFWIEDVIKHQALESGYPYTNMMTIGADYTFGLGTGLNVMSEYFVFSTSDKLFGNDQSISFSGLSVNYGLSIIANINAIVYYDWTNEEIYRFLNLGLSFDRFSYYIMGFWNPERFRIFEVESGPSLFNGAGIQLMMVYNH